MTWTPANFRQQNDAPPVSVTDYWLELGLFAGLFTVAWWHWWAAIILLLPLAHPIVHRHALAILRHQRVRRQWQKALADSIPAPRCGHRRAARPGRIEDVKAGERITLRLGRGMSVDTLQNRTREIASCLRVQEVRVVANRKDASRPTAVIVRRDPFDITGTLEWPNVNAAQLSMWDPIPFGHDDEGNERDVLLDQERATLLMGGETGAGKSGGLRKIAATAALDPDAELWLIDCKRVEFAPWGPCARRIAKTPKEALKLLEDFSEQMDERFAILEREGVSSLTPTLARRLGLPVMVLMIDELGNLTLSDQKKKITDQLAYVVTQCRAAGGRVIAATQKPMESVIPTLIRDNFTYRIAYRCATWQASDTILGDWHTRGYSADTIDPNTRGVCLLLTDGERPHRVKGYWLPDEVVAQVAGRAAAGRADAWLADTVGGTMPVASGGDADPAVEQ